MELKKSLYLCLGIALCFILVSQLNIFSFRTSTDNSTESIISNNQRESNSNSDVIVNNGHSPIVPKYIKKKSTFERDELDMRTHHAYYRDKPIQINKDTQIQRKEKLKNNREFDRSLKFLVKEEYHNESQIIKEMSVEPDFAAIKHGVKPLSLVADKDKLVNNQWKLDEDSNPLLLVKPILFIHIHKTAGTTMRHILLKNVDMEHYFHQDFQPRIEDVPVVLESDFMFGHMRYGLHCYFDRYYRINASAASHRLVDERNDGVNPFSYVTIVRNPVDRVHSHYYYLKEHPDHPMYKEVRVPFNEWIKRNSLADNEMCRRMVGIGRNDKLDEEFGNECLFRLRHSFKFIGITERFDETLVLMTHFLGFQDISYFVRNTGKMKKTNEISPIDRLAIEYRNRYDIAMYREALKLFEKQIDLVGREFFFEELKGYLEKQALPPPDSVDSNYL